MHDEWNSHGEHQNVSDNKRKWSEGQSAECKLLVNKSWRVTVLTVVSQRLLGIYFSIISEVKVWKRYEREKRGRCLVWTSSTCVVTCNICTYTHAYTTHTMKREKVGGREKQGRENLFPALGLFTMSYISCLILKYS